MNNPNTLRGALLPCCRWRFQQAKRLHSTMAKRTRIVTRAAFSLSNDYYSHLEQSKAWQNHSCCVQQWPTIGTPPTRLFSTNKSVASSSSSSSSNINSTVPRTAISLLGAVNAGKSVLMNLLTQSDVSLVHSTAGTTADPKICAMELHGRIGPVRLLDTPGINEQGELGSLKRVRAFDTIGQCDVALIVADPFELDQAESVADILFQVQRRQEMNRLVEEQVDEAGTLSNNTKGSPQSNSSSSSSTSRPTPVALLAFNLRQDKAKMLEATGGSVSMLLEDFEKKVLEKMAASKDDKADTKKKGKGNPTIDPSLPPTLAVDFTSTKESASRDRIISFLERHADPRPNSVHVLPEWLAHDTHEIDGHSPTVFLNIPMDQQTPGMRLLRPQALIQEALIRNYISTYAYRMDLGMARSDDPVQVQKEKERFLRVMDPLLTSGDLSLLITDSQAIDVVAPWTLDESTGEEIVAITTFSIAMIRYLSGGRLGYFADGLRKLDEMVQGKASPRNGEKFKILIAEACNHTRLNMEKECADIGTVQLPNHLTCVLGGQDNVDFDYTFGKHVITDPTRYDFVVHCGGCMLNPQQMDARVADLMAAGVPATNYGLLLSRIQSPKTLTRVLKPWGITYNHEDPVQTSTTDNDLNMETLESSVRTIKSNI